MVCAAGLVLGCAWGQAVEDPIADPSPNPFNSKKLEKESYGATMRHPFHHVRTTWDRYFRVWPAKKEDHQSISLGAVRSEPKFYLDRKIEFDVYWGERGAFYRPVVSPFYRDTHVNYNCWNYETDLWNREQRVDVFPFLYVDRREEKLIQRMEKLATYTPVRLYGEVIVVSEGYPWIQVHEMEVLKEPALGVGSLRDLEQAWLRMEKKDWTLALNGFQRALQRELPLNTTRRVWESVGICYMELYQYASAREAFINHLELFGGPRIQLLDAIKGEQRAVRSLVRLTQCDLRLGYSEEAKQAATVAVTTEPSNALAHVELGLALAQLGDFRQGMWEVDAGQRLVPGGRLPEAFRNRAQIYLLRGQLAQAQTELENAVIHRPNDVQFHMELGDVYLKLNLPEKAQVEFENSTRLAPDRPEAFHMLGVAFKHLGDKAAKEDKKDQAGEHYQKALEMFAKAHQVDDRYAPAYGDHAELLRLLGKDQEAKELLEQGSGASPQSMQMQEMLFNESKKQGDWLAMEKAAMKAALIEPNNAAAHARVAMVRESKPEPDWQGAEEEYGVAVKLDPGHAESWARLAFVRRKLEWWGPGASAAAQAVNLDAGNANAWADLAACRRHLGDVSGAVEAAEQAFAKQDNAASRLNLAIAYIESGKPAHATEAAKLAQGARAESYISTEISNAESVLGAALSATGQHQEALNHFALAENDLQADPWHNYYYGRCLEANGQASAARDHYGKAWKDAAGLAGGSKLMERLSKDAEKAHKKAEKLADTAPAIQPAPQPQPEAQPAAPQPEAKPEEPKSEAAPEGDHQTNGNSNGHSNGHANGHTNGKSNGHTNGNTNGNMNGHTENKPPVIRVEPLPQPAGANEEKAPDQSR